MLQGSLEEVNEVFRFEEEVEDELHYLSRDLYYASFQAPGNMAPRYICFDKRSHSYTWLTMPEMMKLLEDNALHDKVRKQEKTSEECDESTCSTCSNRSSMSSNSSESSRSSTIESSNSNNTCLSKGTFSL